MKVNSLPFSFREFLTHIVLREEEKNGIEGIALVLICTHEQIKYICDQIDTDNSTQRHTDTIYMTESQMSRQSAHTSHRIAYQLQSYSNSYIANKLKYMCKIAVACKEKSRRHMSEPIRMNIQQKLHIEDNGFDHDEDGRR